jgi:hypothetical protein
MQNALNDLVETRDDFENHLGIWAESKHLFPPTWHPPLLLPKNFMESSLKPEIIEQIRAGEVLLQKVSEELQLLLPNNETGIFPERL